MKHCYGKKTILVTGLHRNIDNGEFALLMGLMSGLTHFSCEKIQIYFVCDYPAIGESRLKCLPNKTVDICLIGAKHIPQNKFILPFTRLLSYTCAMEKCQLVVHLGADGLSDDCVGAPLSGFYHETQLLIAHLLGKPVALLSSSVGPFKTPQTRFFAKFALKKIDGLSIRQGHTEGYLKEIGITNFKVVPDLAFIASDAIEEKPCRNNFPIISIVVSRHSKINEYIVCMASVADALVDRGFFVWLIPQIIYGPYNELPIVEQIWVKTKNKSRVKPVCEMITPQGMQKLFLESELVISAKYHAAILSLSTLTPTLCFNYHYKVLDLYRALGLSDLVINVNSTDISGFVKRVMVVIDHALADKTEIRKRLLDIIPDQRINALENVDLLLKYLK